MTQKILVEELKSVAISQDYSLSSGANRNIAQVVPFIYIHNAPAGTFTFSIKDNAGTIASTTFTSTDVKDDYGTSNSYLASWHRLTFSNNVSLKGGNTYTFELSSSGYTYSNTSFIAWVKEHEYRHNKLDYTPVDITRSPMACQLLVYRDTSSL